MSTETVLSETMQVVTFTIAEKSSKKGNYAVPIEQVKEIKTLDTITKIPKSKSYVKGIMNLRGKIIPIIDVNDKIGLSEGVISDNSKQRILVADVNDSLTGLLVDEVNEVMRLSVKDIESPPGEVFETGNYIKGIVNLDEKLIVLLDISKFLNGSSEEISNIQNSENDENPHPEQKFEEDNEGIVPEIDQIIQESQN